MKTQSLFGAFQLHYENNLDAFIPEMWAMESVAILVENMVAPTLVHRDFDMLFQKHGDVVNTRQPAEFTAKRKTGATVTTQDATATNIPVTLDHHVHVSFLIGDGDESKSFKNLVEEYLRPAVIAMARYADQVVLGQYYNFLGNQAGYIGGLTSSNAVNLISNTGLVMNRNKAHQTGRQMIWTPEAEALIIQNPTFHEADKVGDDGTALREASLGRKLKFTHWMAQNMAEVQALASPAETGTAVDLPAGYAKGTTTIHVDGFSDNTASLIKAGQWLSINGVVYQTAAAVTPVVNEGDVTLTYGLKEAVANDDAIIFYASANLINLAAGYDAGHLDYINVDDGAGAAPDEIQVGQILTINGANYSVMETVAAAGGTVDVLLDRALASAVVDNTPVLYGPHGGGFNLDSIATH